MKVLKISVVTPSFNSENTIRESIESVYAQSYKNWEHICVGTCLKKRSFPPTVVLTNYPPDLVAETEKKMARRGV